MRVEVRIDGVVVVLALEKFAGVVIHPALVEPRRKSPQPFPPRPPFVLLLPAPPDLARWCPAWGAGMPAQTFSGETAHHLTTPFPAEDNTFGGLPCTSPVIDTDHIQPLLNLPSTAASH